MTDLALVYDAVLAKHRVAKLPQSKLPPYPDRWSRPPTKVLQFVEFEMTKFSSQGISSVMFRLGEEPGLSNLQLIRLFPSESNMYRLQFFSDIVNSFPATE